MFADMGPDFYVYLHGRYTMQYLAALITLLLSTVLPSQNLLSNGTFDKPIGGIAEGWQMNAWPGAQWAATNTAGVQRVQLIAQNNQGFGVIFNQVYRAQAGITYRFTIRARSSTNSRVALILRKTTPYYQKGAAKFQTLGPQWSTIECVGGFELATNANVGIKFADHKPGVVEIDDAVMIDVTVLQPQPAPFSIDAKSFGMTVNKPHLPHVYAGPKQSVRIHDNFAHWRHIQAGGRFSWNTGRLNSFFSYIDRVAPRADVTYVMCPIAPWASKNGRSNGAPSDAQHVRDFLDRLLNEFDGKIKYIQPWNEWNDSNWYAGSVADMVELCKTVKQHLKDRHPGVLVVGPSIQSIGVEELANFLDEGGGQWVDKLAIHYYNDPHPMLGHDTRVWFPYLNACKFLKLQYNIGGMPLVVTEGNVTDPRWVRGTTDWDRETGALLDRIFEQLAYGIKQFDFYCYDISHHDRNCAMAVQEDNYVNYTPVGRAYDLVTETWLLHSRMVGRYYHPQSASKIIALVMPDNTRAFLVWNVTMQHKAMLPKGVKEVRDAYGNVSGPSMFIDVGLVPKLVIMQ
jgi:hypothetical protein